MSLVQGSVVRSPLPDVAIPHQSYADFILERAAAIGDRAAIIDAGSGRTLTYAGLADGVRRLAFGLSRRGFGKGDVLAIYLPNVPEYATAFLAAARLGGVVTTVNPLYTADELAFQLRDAGARVLLTLPQLMQSAASAARMAGVEDVVVVGESDGATPLAQLMAEDGDPPSVSIDPDTDVLALPYSSGTTGLPKGVMLTHANLVANICQFAAMQQTLEGDRVIAVLPFFHIYGMVVIMGASLRLGCTLVSLPRFDLQQFLSALQDHAITVAYLVPPIVLALAKHPLVDSFNLSNLRLIFSGAAPLGAELERACSARLDCPVQQGYGLTETSPVTHANPPSAMGGARAGSVGVPVPNTECKVIDAVTGDALGPREEGEVCIRGPQVMQGYLNNPEATEQMLQADGWLRTGDIGYVDAEGYLYLVDRLKELIKYKGMQVAPAELEAILLSHPSVADAAVIPSPDEEAGEVPKAFVVRRPETVTGEAELIGYVAERVAPHKRVRMVEFVDQIPKSASGKILRRVLVARERERAQP